ncbi:hypothetical protein T4B_15564 [Trichinella pseudospiralis]|uniref:Uncharacterized protein n=1 Tax=Trichinella pseudospiralis TaxID=6337 RepID=A0A0V1J8S8_TRIPS|nr:hypothetical protein T4C_5207 [Trichinella pseudospiralis]KRZ31383.1 hypothetical protein T4B_15564 [Trichinella pseudospiralis]
MLFMQNFDKLIYVSAVTVECSTRKRSIMPQFFYQTALRLILFRKWLSDSPLQRQLYFNKLC